MKLQSHTWAGSLICLYTARAQLQSLCLILMLQVIVFPPAHILHQLGVCVCTNAYIALLYINIGCKSVDVKPHRSIVFLHCSFWGGLVTFQSC